MWSWSFYKLHFQSEQQRGRHEPEPAFVDRVRKCNGYNAKTCRRRESRVTQPLYDEAATWLFDHRSNHPTSRSNILPHSLSALSVNHNITSKLFYRSSFIIIFFLSPSGTIVSSGCLVHSYQGTHSQCVYGNNTFRSVQFLLSP